MSHRTVILDAPGVVAVGHYLPGRTYTVSEAEAGRLVAVKGFRYADEPASPGAAEPASDTPHGKRRHKPAIAQYPTE